MHESVILLPTYNERENLPRVVPRLSALASLSDVLVIDDGSPDGTGDLADLLASEYPRLSVLHRKRKEGLGKAYIHGFRVALARGYRRLVTMDADLSHLPEDVPLLLDALDGADVAVGSRHLPGRGVKDWPRSRRTLSRLGSLYARVLLRLPLSDATSGFRAYRAETLARLDFASLRAEGYVFQIEILRRILDLPGTRAVEVPIVFRDRDRGISKLSGMIILEALWEVLRLSVRRRSGRDTRRIPDVAAGIAVVRAGERRLSEPPNPTGGGHAS